MTLFLNYIRLSLANLSAQAIMNARRRKGVYHSALMRGSMLSPYPHGKKAGRP